ncbi:MAG: aminotransferase class V-fold PLP-dependent enzyme [Planctomycetota bacterium]|nr:aminotransferase class V-fold PLP-dependent enzyme [Planctomycetota bacterium]
MPDLYLDHAATSPPLPEALAAFADACARGFANPGSLHQKGADAARILQTARKDLKKAFGADSYQVIWAGTGMLSIFIFPTALCRHPGLMNIVVMAVTGTFSPSNSM